MDSPNPSLDVCLKCEHFVDDIWNYPEQGNCALDGRSQFWFLRQSGIIYWWHAYTTKVPKKCAYMLEHKISDQPLIGHSEMQPVTSDGLIKVY